MAQLGRSPETLDGILLTHEHTDHTQGLKALCAKLEIPVYCNRLTADELRFRMDTKLDVRQFITGQAFEIGDMTVENFSVPHDAQDPVGFHIRTADGGIGVLTDLGQATRLVLERVRGVSALFIEANYDPTLLQEDTRRPWAIKQRIMSRHGHLANSATAEAIENLANGTLRNIVLGHLSRDCNTPEIAKEAVAEKLGQAASTAPKSTSPHRPIRPKPSRSNQALGQAGSYFFILGQRRRPFCSHSRHTIQIASRTILPLIFEVPMKRSVKMIGTSATLWPVRQRMCVNST